MERERERERERASLVQVIVIERNVLTDVK